MSLGPLGMLGSLAATPLAQTKGTEVDRVRNESSDRARETESEQLEEKAAGVEQTEEEKGASDRDADGRRLWEGPPKAPPSKLEQEAPPADNPPVSKDATGLAGKN